MAASWGMGLAQDTGARVCADAIWSEDARDYSLRHSESLAQARTDTQREMGSLPGVQMFAPNTTIEQAGFKEGDTVDVIIRPLKLQAQSSPNLNRRVPGMNRCS